jgi:hypothetical protein
MNVLTEIQQAQVLAIMVRRLGGNVEINQSELFDIEGSKLFRVTEPKHDKLIFTLIEPVKQISGKTK